MSTGRHIGLRISEELVRRLDALIPVIQKDPTAAAASGPGGVTRSTVLRLVLDRGLALIEADLAKAEESSCQA